MSNDPFEVLGVSRTAPDSVIKAAYKARIRETHPDAGGDPAAAKEVNDAYDILTDLGRREAFLRTSTPPAPAQDAPRAPQASPAQDAPQTPPADHGMYENASTSAGPTPEPVYSTYEVPGPLWRRPLVWVPALLLLAVATAASGWVGAACAVAAIAVTVKRSWLGVVAGAVLAYIPSFTPDLLGAVWLPINGLAPYLFILMIALRWFARRREQNDIAAHIGDVFATTRDKYNLTPYIVAGINPGNGIGLVHLERADGQREWPMPTAQWDGRVAQGEAVLVHQGRIIASAFAVAFTQYNKRVARAARRG